MNAAHRAIIDKSENELAILCDEYEAWNKAQGLNLGSADEHIGDESLTPEQRAWLVDFSNRWNAASIVFDADGPRQIGDQT